MSDRCDTIAANSGSLGRKLTVEEHLSDGYIPRSADGTFDLATTEPRAVVRVRFTAVNPTPGTIPYRRTEYLRAANQPSTVLTSLLEQRGHVVERIADVALVCEACQYPIGALTHTAC